jgi:hypothetical protein
VCTSVVCVRLFFAMCVRLNISYPGLYCYRCFWVLWCHLALYIKPGWGLLFKKKKKDALRPCYEGAVRCRAEDGHSGEADEGWVPEGRVGGAAVCAAGAFWAAPERQPVLDMGACMTMFWTSESLAVDSSHLFLRVFITCIKCRSIDIV